MIAWIFAAALVVQEPFVETRITLPDKGAGLLLRDLTGDGALDLVRVDDWASFLSIGQRIVVAVAPLENGVILPAAGIAIISEQQLFGERAKQRTRRHRADRDPETIIRQLDDLQEGSPVVHAEYGVGRYRGLMTLVAGGIGFGGLVVECCVQIEKRASKSEHVSERSAGEAAHTHPRGAPTVHVVSRSGGLARAQTLPARGAPCP